MNWPRDCHIEWSKSGKQISWNIAYLQNLGGKWYRLIYLQSRERHRCREQTYGYQGEKGERYNELGDGDWHTHLWIKS